MTVDEKPRSLPLGFKRLTSGFGLTGESQNGMDSKRGKESGVALRMGNSRHYETREKLNQRVFGQFR